MIFTGYGIRSNGEWKNEIQVGMFCDHFSAEDMPTLKITYSKSTSVFMLARRQGEGEVPPPTQ